MSRALTHAQLQFFVHYGATITRSKRVLRVWPLPAAAQSVLKWRLDIDPQADSVRLDEAGGLEIRHERIEGGMLLELDLSVATSAEPWREDEPLSADNTTGANRWGAQAAARASRLVDLEAFGALPEVEALLHRTRGMEPLERAREFNLICFEHLDYRLDTEAAPRPASKVWSERTGSCADFAHVFVALCRASGLSARYVAGFGVGEGQMHAWAQVLNDGLWHAFDPTHGRKPSPGSIATSVGRDFHDCSPNLGTFNGEATPRIELHCRAEVVSSPKAALRPAIALT